MHTSSVRRSPWGSRQRGAGSSRSPAGHAASSTAAGARAQREAAAGERGDALDAGRVASHTTPRSRTSPPSAARRSAACSRAGWARARTGRRPTRTRVAVAVAVAGGGAVGGERADRPALAAREEKRAAPSSHAADGDAPTAAAAGLSRATSLDVDARTAAAADDDNVGDLNLLDDDRRDGAVVRRRLPAARACARRAPGRAATSTRRRP